MQGPASYPCPDRFELTGVELGSGAASNVMECRGKGDGVLYAVKVLSKANPIVARNRDQVPSSTPFQLHSHHYRSFVRWTCCACAGATQMCCR